MRASFSKRNGAVEDQGSPRGVGQERSNSLQQNTRTLNCEAQSQSSPAGATDSRLVRVISLRIALLQARAKAAPTLHLSGDGGAQRESRGQGEHRYPCSSAIVNRLALQPHRLGRCELHVASEVLLFFSPRSGYLVHNER